MHPDNAEQQAAAPQQQMPLELQLEMADDRITVLEANWSRTLTELAASQTEAVRLVRALHRAGAELKKLQAAFAHLSAKLRTPAEKPAPSDDPAHDAPAYQPADHAPGVSAAAMAVIASDLAKASVPASV